MSDELLVSRMSQREHRQIAREHVLSERIFFLANDRRARDAFFMILPFCHLTEAQVRKVGGLIGDTRNVVPGRGVNGMPIFTSVRFVHVNDVPYIIKEITAAHERIDA